MINNPNRLSSGDVNQDGSELIGNSEIFDKAREFSKLALDGRSYDSMDEAIAVGMEMSTLFDTIAYEKGLLGLEIFASGPGLRAPSVSANYLEGSLHLIPSPPAEDATLAPYETMKGKFYGFHSLLDVFVDSNPEIEKTPDVVSETGPISTYKPRLVAVIRHGNNKLEFAIATVELNIFADVLSCELSLNVDKANSDFIIGYSDLVNSIESTADSELTQIAHFYHLLEQSISPETYSEMVYCIQLIASNERSEYNSHIIDILMQALKKKINDNLSNISHTANFAFEIQNLGDSNKEQVKIHSIENGQLNSMLSVFQDMAIMPFISVDMHDDDSVGSLSENDQCLYMVYKSDNEEDLYIPALSLLVNNE